MDVYKLDPSWTAPGGGGVWSAYYGPPVYNAVSPGKVELYDGREAGIIKAGLTPDPVDGHYWDEGLFAFKVPSVDISTFSGQALAYDVQNETGTNPVWVRIRFTNGTQYQFVPLPYTAGAWNTVNAAIGKWYLMDSNGNATGDPVVLNQLAANSPALVVDRVYLTLGMGDSYNVSPGVGTVAWIDKVTIDEVTYDFVLRGNSVPGGDRYTNNLGRQQATEVGAQCGTGASSGSFGYFGEDWNLGNDVSGHYIGSSGWDETPGANGYQTGLNNSGVCGNRP